MISAITGSSVGDEGKGKMTDLLAFLRDKSCDFGKRVLTVRESIF